MPSPLLHRTPRRFNLAFLALGIAVAVMLMLPGATSAWVLNQAQFDTGVCGHLSGGGNLTSSPTPWFLVYGDGNRSSYTIFIDGVSIGTFSSDNTSNVCINNATRVLSDGPHVLTGNELAPNASNVVTPFSFSVDTVPPPAPSTPALASYSDSGVAGDNITMFPTPSLTGTSVPSVSIHLYDNGVSGIGGGSADSTGGWTSGTISLADGTHTITAAAFDPAGNKSAASGSLSLTIDTAPPLTSLTSPSSGSTVSGIANLAATATDNLGIWKVDFQVDGVTKATDTTSPYTYAWDSTAVVNGSHTLTEITTDLAGHTASASVTVTVSNTSTATVPGAPTLNSATGENFKVNLAWSAPASNGGSAITNYKIYRSTTSGNEILLTTVGNVALYSDGSVANGTTYYYTVTAKNAVGESALSGERSATPGASTATLSSIAVTPAAPSVAKGTNRQFVATGTYSDGSTAVVTSSVTWASASTTVATISSVGLAQAVGTGTSTISATLGSVSGSTVLTVTAATTAPSAPTLTSATPGNSVTLSWEAPASDGGSPLTGYKIYRGTTSGGEVFLVSIGAVTSYTDATTVDGTTYYYQVSALNSAGESVRSVERSATPDNTVPSTPSSLLKLLTGTSQVVIDWPSSTDNVGVTGYQIFRDGVLIPTVQTTTFYLDSGLAPGSSHTYQVRAVDANGNQSKASPSLIAKVASLATGSTGTLSGVVFNQSGKLLQNANASLTLSTGGAAKNAKTDRRGVWKISNLPAGDTYQVTVTLSGYRAQSFTLTAAGGQTLIAATELMP